MSTDTEIRALAREHGHEVGDKGKIAAGLRALYEADHEPAPELLDDYDAGVTEADFPPEPLDETPPRKVPPAKGQGWRHKAWGGKPKTKGTARAKARKRIPVDRLISRAWEIGARLAATVSLPVARVLGVQAPVAGLILEDVVKETIVDRLLQPLARAEQGGEAVIALAGPPLIVGMLERKPEAAPVLVPMLRESLAIWLTIAGPKVTEARKRREQFETEFGADIDALMAMFFAGIPGFEEAGPEAEEAAAEAEDEAVKRAQGML